MLGHWHRSAKLLLRGTSGPCKFHQVSTVFALGTQDIVAQTMYVVSWLGNSCTNLYYIHLTSTLCIIPANQTWKRSLSRPHTWPSNVPSRLKQSDVVLTLPFKWIQMGCPVVISLTMSCKRKMLGFEGCLIRFAKHNSATVCLVRSISEPLCLLSSSFTTLLCALYTEVAACI